MKEVRQSVALAAAKAARKLSPARFDETGQQRPIKLHYWVERPNFGDVLSPAIVEWVSGQSVAWAPIASCNMISTGSIYGWLRGNAPRYFRNVHVWGSGLHYPEQAIGSIAFIQHHLVRGPLTAMVAKNDALPQGDPGLLGADVYGIKASPTAKGIGFIPHRSLWSKPDYIEKLQAIPGAKLIDMQITDCRQVIEEMADCEMIFSSSLHGLVLADAMKIPNYWMVSPFHKRHIGHAFKFMDYGFAIGRMLTEELDPFTIDIWTHHEKRGDFRYFENIDRVKHNIRCSFPFYIFGGPNPQLDPKLFEKVV